MIEELTYLVYLKRALTQNTLILCDIDDVILYFPKIHRTWWKDTFDELYAIHKDYDKVEKIQYDMWYNIIHNNDNNCLHTIESYELANMLYATKSEIEFVTARDISLKDITEEHLSTLSDKKVHYVGNNCKGAYIKEHIMPYRKEYNKIIFIDDLLQNVEDVQRICNIECYHFKNLRPECIFNHRCAKSDMPLKSTLEMLNYDVNIHMNTNGIIDETPLLYLFGEYPSEQHNTIKWLVNLTIKRPKMLCLSETRKKQFAPFQFNLYNENYRGTLYDVIYRLNEGWFVNYYTDMIKYIKYFINCGAYENKYVGFKIFL